MAIKSYSRIALKIITSDFGVIESLTIDGSKEQSAPGTEFIKICLQN